MKEKIKSKIDEILKLIEELKSLKPIYSTNYDDLSIKFKNLKNSFENNQKELSEMINWCKWFAPRIIFDGTGEESLLKLINELNLLFENN